MKWDVYKKIVLSIVFLWCIYGIWRLWWYLLSQWQENNDYINNEIQISKWDIIKSISLLWKTKYANTQKISFTQQWKIVVVYKKVWDKVQKWDILAQLDSFELDNELAQAQLSLDQQYNDLEKAKKDMAFTQAKNDLNAQKLKKNLTLLEEKYRTSQQELGVSLKEIDDDMKVKKESYNVLERSYNDILKKYNLKKATLLNLSGDNSVLSQKTLITSVKNELLWYIESTENNLDTLDKVMYYTDKYVNWDKPGYLTYIWWKNLDAKIQTENNFFQLNSNTKNLRNKINSFVTTNKSDDEIRISLLSLYKDLKYLGQTQTALSESTKKMFEADIIDGRYTWTPVSIPNGNTIENIANTNIETLVNTSSFDTIEEKNNKELEKLENDMITTKQALDKASLELEKMGISTPYNKLSKTNDRDLLSIEVQSQKITLQQAQEESLNDISTKEIAIQQKQKEIANIMKKYDNYTLKANFDGVITKMNMQVGDNIWWSSNTSSTEEKYIYIENPDLLEVIVDVDQSDIVKLKIGMEVSITLDALPEKTFSGYFSEINTIPSEGSNGGTTTYQTKVVFQKWSDDQILWSMTANVSVVLEEQRGVLLVPNVALNDENGQIAVLKKNDTTFVSTDVTIGIADETNTEIISWLQEGDVVMWVYITDSTINNAGIVDKSVSY
jgi:HlyD family secretion protein